MLRATLLKLSESRGFAHWVTSNPTTRRMARRFVPGETLDDAIIAARACNSQGMYTSLDYLGENVATVADAQRARDAYLAIFDRIAPERLHANVSCKLTQLGLDLSPDFCQGLLLSLVERAAGYENFLRVDMESSVYTQRDRKSTRLNSSHANISYAVFCLKKKKKHRLSRSSRS